MIKTLLIANRGEIACRIIKTAQKMGIRTVAVHSDADANAMHVRMADVAVRIGPAAAAESYLLAETIIQAAKDTHADAIHPGYGFLSENAAFAEAVQEAGLIWVGPPAASIKAMGLKDAAKSLMQNANVPTTPGYLGEDQSPDRLKSEADAIGYPVLIKAVAGGGGKGMRKVDDPAQFKDALSSCQREAKSSFSDDRVLLEKWITDPRHIEVQIFGDQHGNVVHLFERDCTLQRRHQKVIEEAPAPGMDEATRQSVCMAAVNAAKAVNYVGAGTVEFIADGSGSLNAERIWFMEMNTRLQVEHPVTECITGQDLVEWQLRVAAGEALPLNQDELSINGWAMEARLYAESPESGFLPSTGPLELLNLPDEMVRVDTGVAQGDSVTPYYDPMIAKLIASGASRDEARLALAKACDAVTTWPVKNNAGFLSALLRRAEFADANITTGFIETHQDALTAPLPLSPTSEGVAADWVQSQFTGRENAPWNALSGFRLNSSPADNVLLRVDDVSVTVSASQNRPTTTGTHLFPNRDHAVLVQHGWPYKIAPRRDDGEASAAVGSGTITSPMPGRILSVSVSEGETVVEGQKLVTIEAMKMEHALKAPFDGTVSGLSANADAQVTDGQHLMDIISNEKDDA